MAIIYEILIDETSIFKEPTTEVSKARSLQSRTLRSQALTVDAKTLSSDALPSEEITAMVRSGVAGRDKSVMADALKATIILTTPNALTKAGMLTTVGSSMRYGLPKGQSVPVGGSVLDTSFDNPVCNIQKAALTQVCIPEEMSSGRMGILCPLLAQVTGRQELSALIDASDCFDAGAAESAGVNLSRLLWVRCGKKQKATPAESGKKPELRGAAGRRMKPIEQAFKAADIVIQNGGLGLIVIDLGAIEERLVRKIPLTTWFRFARVIEKQPTALVVFATYPAAQSCAALTLHIKNSEMHWSRKANSEARAHTNKRTHSGPCLADAQDRGDAQQQDIAETCQADKVMPHAQFLSGLTYEVEMGRVRGQGRKPVQSSAASFAAKPILK
jgi:hypothetical protein